MIFFSQILVPMVFSQWSPQSFLRLPGDVHPIKQLIRLEPHFGKDFRTGITIGYTRLHVEVKNPTDRITLNMNDLYLTIDTAKTSARNLIGNNGVFAHILNQEYYNGFFHIIFGQGLFFPTQIFFIIA